MGVSAGPENVEVTCRNCGAAFVTGADQVGSCPKCGGPRALYLVRGEKPETASPLSREPVLGSSPICPSCGIEADGNAVLNDLDAGGGAVVIHCTCGFAYHVIVYTYPQFESFP